MQSRRKFVRATTTQLPWQVRNFDLILWLLSMSEQHRHIQDMGFEPFKRLWNGPQDFPHFQTNKQCNNNDFITSRRHKNVIMTFWLHNF